ncbi:MAG: HAD-IIB family hydrolase [Candidatus Saccharibacteria bacterium]|nr:HAD-IIB family hydrolase [Candidatus Saccharibacteria bacterium]
MKKVLSFDLDDTLNVAKVPIPPEIASLLTGLTKYYEICPISGQKFEQFLIQIVNPMKVAGATPSDFTHLHLFVAQGTQYYRYNISPKDTIGNVAPDKYSEKNWELIYNYPLNDRQIQKITETIERAARELDFWHEPSPGDEIIENRLSQVTFSALGQKAGTEEKYAWDPDHKKREKIVARCQELAPEFGYEIGGTTSINVFQPGMNKVFGMTHLMEELKVRKADILYFGDMTQEGGNDYPVVEMGIDTISVRNWEDTAYALRGILGAHGDLSLL